MHIARCTDLQSLDILEMHIRIGASIAEVKTPIGPWHSTHRLPVVKHGYCLCLYSDGCRNYKIRLSEPGWCSKSHRGSRRFLVSKPSSSFCRFHAHVNTPSRTRYHEVIVIYIPDLGYLQTLDLLNQTDLHHTAFLDFVDFI